MKRKSSENKKQDWNEHDERSNPFTLKLICWIALNIGRNVARLFLYPITLYFFITSPKVVKSSKNYLRRVSNKNVSVGDVFKHIYHFSATILDRVYFLTDQHDRFDVNIYGHEIIEDLIAKGKGGILLGTHHGSFEVLRSLVNKNKEIPLKVLMYRDHNQMITRILDELNPTIADTVINLADSDALLQMQEAVDNGYFVGMLGDRVTEGERKNECILLNDKADFPSGPILLASILKVPVILFYGIYHGANRYDIHIELLAEDIQIKRQQREHDVQIWTQKFVSRLEYYIRVSPYNWFNFYDFWNDEVKKK